MLKNLVKLENIVEGKAHHFLCDNDCQLAGIKESLVKFLSYIQQIEDQVKSQQAKDEAEKKEVEQPKVEVDNVPSGI